MRIADAIYSKFFINFAIGEYKELIAKNIAKFITQNNYDIIISDFKHMEA
jgi:hypothetical protein